MAATFERRGAGSDLLHEVFEEHLGAVLDELDRRDRSLPRHVLREVDAFRSCSDLSQGFAWLRCPGCDHHRLVPMSCSGRAFCPSCGGRRMVVLAQHWVQRVLPRVAVRQFVLTLPWRLRALLAYRPDVCRAARNAFLRVVQDWVVDKARAQTGDRVCTGAITVTQRAGSSLSLNPHFHALVPQGGWVEEQDGSVRFVSVPPPTTDEVEELVERVAQRVERWLVRHGHLEQQHDPLDDPDAQLVLQVASLSQRAALGVRAGRKTRRMRVLGGR